MGKKLLSLIFCIILLSFVSAETTIIFNQQPNKVYNFGDSFSLPIKIATTSDVNGLVNIHLICNGKEQIIPQGIIQLKSGEEKKLESLIIFTKKYIGDLQGTCIVKVSLGEIYELTEEFRISDLITTNLTSQKTEVFPEEEILIQGTSKKESGDAFNGFVELKIVSEDLNEEEKYMETISNGLFSIKFTLPKETKAGKYLVSLNMYEKDSEGEITNKGFIDYNILVKQVPTSLEILFEKTEIEPGTNLKVKVILHDQTGEKINSVAIITLKNLDNKILEQIEKQTDEFLEYEVLFNQPPTNWTVVAVSNKLTSEATCTIGEKEDVKVELKNKTLVLTNIGNVIYNKTVLVKIGKESVNVDALLAVGESKKYVLSAPDGEYQVEVISDGENKVTGNAILTGSAVDIKEAGDMFLRHPLVWAFIIVIMGFVAFIFFKKGYKKSFFGYIKSKKKIVGSSESKKKLEGEKGSIFENLKSKNKAVLSLSLKGDKQNSSVICLKIKNSSEIAGEKGNASETLQNLIDIAEDKRACTYSNQDYLFFILAPLMTRTFQNEKVVVDIANGVKKILDDHNRLSKQKIDFGISLNYGAIVAKKDGEILKFMSFGDLMATAKKIATNSDKEVLISEKMNERFRVAGGIQAEKKIVNNIPVYILTKVRNIDKENEKFLTGFISRLEKEKREKK